MSKSVNYCFFLAIYFFTGFYHSMNIFSDNINFTGRCSQVKDAQWVCHVVNTAFPNVSTTRFSAPLYKLKQENAQLYYNFINKNQFQTAKPYNYNELKLFVLFDWQKHLVEKLNNVRRRWQSDSKNSSRLLCNVIKQLKLDKIGNCGEDALLSEAILKINGIDNSYTAALCLNDSKIDHRVCVFNRDGTKFDGKVTKNTIIIDPWIGAADFAQNMFLNYKRFCNKYFFNIKDNSKLGLIDVKSLDMSGEELLLLTLKYDKLLFPGITKEFMR